MYRVCMLLMLTLAAYGQEEKAVELYEQGLALYNEGAGKLSAYRKAEEVLLRARTLVPNDQKRLKFTVYEDVLVKPKPWPKWERVPVTRSKPYFPNRLIRKIRGQIPPMPSAQAVIVKKSGTHALLVAVHNQGKARMENLVVRPGGLPPKTIPSIEAGGKHSLRWSLPTTFETEQTLVLEFQERYALAPCRLVINP